CTFAGTCFSEGARARAGEAELVIANHALYFADLALRTAADGVTVLPEHDVVVFDEAHRLEDAAAAWFGGRVSVSGLRQLARDVERAAREAGRAPPAGPLADVERAGELLLGRLDPGSGRRRLTDRELEPLLELGLELGDGLSRLAWALLYAPHGLPEPRSPGYYGRLAEEVIALCRLSRGRALVLTSSYRALDELADRAQGRLPYTILRQGAAPRERLLERFRSDVDS